MGVSRREPLTHPLSVAAWVLLVAFTALWLLLAWPWAFYPIYWALYPLYVVAGRDSFVVIVWLGIPMYLLIPAAIVSAGCLVYSGRRPGWRLLATGTVLLAAASVLLPGALWAFGN